MNGFGETKRIVHIVELLSDSQHSIAAGEFGAPVMPSCVRYFHEVEYEGGSGRPPQLNIESNLNPASAGHGEKPVTNRDPIL